MKNFTSIGEGIFVHKNVKLGKNVSIGHGSCIGYGDTKDGELIIEDNVQIGAFCVLHFGSTIKENAFIDHRCVISSEVEIGKNSKIISGKEIGWKAKIGSNCIIGGNVADRTVIEDNVTYLGEIAHSHRNASLNWDETEEPSPIIKRGSVIGVNALIIGGRVIGPCAYIGAGEIVRYDIGHESSLMKGEIKPLSYYRGQFKTRCI